MEGLGVHRGLSMTASNDQQKKLVFDYCLGQLPEEECDQVDEIVAENSEAGHLCQCLQSILRLLDSMVDEACPEELSQRTLDRLKQAKQSNQENQKEIISAERAPQPTIKVDFWRQFTQVAAVAAIVLFLASVSIPSLKMAREKYYLSRCQTQFNNIYQGLVSYTADFERGPTINMTSGSPWWKVGYQGEENYSNTRAVWLLSRHGYVEPEKFVCPARPKSRQVDYSNVNPGTLYDFPGRAYIDYSSRVCCENQSRMPSGKMVLMADMNPLSERIPTDHSKSLKIRLDESILNPNSINHGRRGQNVLLYDGSVGFNKTRYLRSSQDDFFSLVNMTYGSEISGCELPSSDKDAFLAP
jgi:hypothetical protein